MYKLLLCLRYLRTRYIALASITSVTLGVATMIVVNSVMAGFQAEMYTRLHGILSDIVVEAHSMEGIDDPEILEQEIRKTLGDDLAGVTSTVHIPAMLSFQVRGQWITRQLNLIGIDDATYANVSDFSKYLLHPENRRQLSFLLRDDGYGQRLRDAGWPYRRVWAAQERLLRQQRQRRQRLRDERAAHAAKLEKAPTAPPLRGGSGEAEVANGAATTAATDNSPSPPMEEDLQRLGVGNDPFAQLPDDAPQDAFDPAQQQHVGIVLGIGTANIRQRNAKGEVVDIFLCRPGDDVKVTFPTAGTPPQAVSGNFTVVDFYESQMSEYDSSFAFVPIRYLQQLRGMVDPRTGAAAVSSIQLKLRDGVDLNAARDKLRARFPVELFPYRIQTWQEMQGPLLAAVQLETTILNILLFLIIAVAGFGILATFFMIVVEKTRDVGILKALGAPSRGIMSIFLAYGLSLGCVGSGVGLGLGLLFVFHINTIADGLEHITGREVFDPTVYYFQEIPTIVNGFTISWIVAGAMLIAVLASVLPALRAARMHPVRALRYE